MEIITIIICIVFTIFIVLTIKKQKMYKNINTSNTFKILDSIKRIDTWLYILIWCEVLLFICLFLVL